MNTYELWPSLAISLTSKGDAFLGITILVIAVVAGTMLWFTTTARDNSQSDNDRTDKDDDYEKYIYGRP